MGALMAAQRDFETHVLDVVTEGPKPELVAALGAEYHHVRLADAGVIPDIVIEATGIPVVIEEAIECTAANGVVCLTGVSHGGQCVEIDLGAINRSLVLENHVVFGSVNANRRHYEAAARALADADRAWLERVITRRVPLESFAEALKHRDDDVKVVIEL
jgi:threonine dehydrogenase-like Zn-dependent dehydrogenase